MRANKGARMPAGGTSVPRKAGFRGPKELRTTAGDLVNRGLQSTLRVPAWVESSQRHLLHLSYTQSCALGTLTKTVRSTCHRTSWCAAGRHDAQRCSGAGGPSAPL